MNIEELKIILKNLENEFIHKYNCSLSETSEWIDFFAKRLLKEGFMMRKADRTFINAMKISDNRDVTFAHIKEQMYKWADQIDEFLNSNEEKLTVTEKIKELFENGWEAIVGDNDDLGFCEKGTSNLYYLDEAYEKMKEEK